MAVTIAMVIGNVCLSRRRKADIESSKICMHTLVSLTHLVSQEPDQMPVV
jgi:hypothetical protein